VVSKQQDAIQQLCKELKQARDMVCKQQDAIEQLSEELRQARDQIDALVRNATPPYTTQTSPRASYTEVARTLPASQPSGLRTISLPNTTPTTFTDTLFCTVDTSRVEESEKGKVQVADIRKAIEAEIQTHENQGTWRYAAVVKEARNLERIRVICRDKSEVALVKEAAQKITVLGVRVLRDQLYPVRIDNTNRTAVLDTEGKILPGAAEALGRENEVNIAKIAWLSRKDAGKAYSSMVVYITKGSEARRLLDARYFYLAGESAYIAVFAPRKGPIQCFNCQELGYKAFACKKPQTYRRYAEQGHYHNIYQATVIKCVLYRGPYESFSKNCRVRWLYNSIRNASDSSA
jgi:uncharacterized coiled-coil protein SlyX